MKGLHGSFLCIDLNLTCVYFVGPDSGLQHSPKTLDGLVHGGDSYCQKERNQGTCDET
jgi:hypothetical protein